MSFVFLAQNFFDQVFFFSGVTTNVLKYFIWCLFFVFTLFYAVIVVAAGFLEKIDLIQ
jgi:hypothetical protein